ncbi:MAG TPA: alpha/beta hydrolase [Mycobacteriales bacterium]|nr:alpha/beta hydrolase [Mycobacteriales bacterium]
MSRYLRMSALGAALTANGLRPLPASNIAAIPSFFASWLTSELAAHNLAITTAGTAAHLTGQRRRRTWTREDSIGTALNLASLAGLAVLVRRSLGSAARVEAALAEALGDDYRNTLGDPSTADLAMAWQRVMMPWLITDPQVERISDIDYVGDGIKRHRLDVYRPRSVDPGAKLPVVIQVHGGAWILSQKNQQGIPLMTHLAARGWICVAPNYPLSPKAKWPEHLVALKQAIAWTKANIAGYGGDPTFVCVTGGSAGGHLAAMMALTPNDPRFQPGFEEVDTALQAAVPFYGVYDIADTLQTKAGRDRLDRFLSRVMFDTHELSTYESATALLHVRETAPPFFVIHGTNDSLVPVAEARALVELLRASSKEVVAYAELPGTQHGFDVFHSIRGAHVIRGVERFLTWVHAAHDRGATQAC